VPTRHIENAIGADLMIRTQEKQAILSQWQVAANDTGSAQAQIGLLTARIEDISQHVKGNHKDNSSKLGLTKLVARRRKLLSYLERHDYASFELIKVRIKSKKKKQVK
jgi:small subunit ribosomal protein S15